MKNRLSISFLVLQILNSLFLIFYDQESNLFDSNCVYKLINSINLGSFETNSIKYSQLKINKYQTNFFRPISSFLSQINTAGVIIFSLYNKKYKPKENRKFILNIVLCRFCKQRFFKDLIALSPCKKELHLRCFPTSFNLFRLFC